MTFAALQPLADRAALYAALRQEQLTAQLSTLGEHRWDVNLPAGTLTFSALADPSRQLVARAHFIATVAPGPRSALWAWAHPQGDTAGVSTRLRDYGSAQGIAELSTAELALPITDEVALNAAAVASIIEATAGQIALAAVEATGLAPFYLAPLEGGTQAVLLLEAPIPALSLNDALNAMPKILETQTLHDQRTSLWGLTRLAGWSLQWTDETFASALVQDGILSMLFTFDQQGRITGFSPAA